MLKLSKKDQKEEIKRIEERSLFYLKYFTLFWSTIIFFIVREIKINPTASKIFSNFLENFLDYYSFQGLLTFFGFCFFLFLIPSIIVFLSLINVRGILSYKGDKNYLETLLVEKYDSLMNLLRDSFIVSFLLLLYLAFLFFLNNELFVYKIQLLGNIIVFLITLWVLYLAPLWSFVNNIKNWNEFNILKRITEIFGVVFFLIISLDIFKIIINWNFSLGLIFMLLLATIFMINFYRFYPIISKKTFSIVFKFFKDENN